MPSIWESSTTPANNTLAAPNGWPEGMNPSDVNNTARQLMANIIGANLAIVASGTDTYACTLNPAPTALVDGMTIRVRFTNANTSTTPTLNANTLGAVTITKYGDQPLIAGDITAAHEAILTYVSANPSWEIMNPKPIPGSGGAVTSVVASSPLSGGGTAATVTLGLGSASITNALLATVAPFTLKGNNTGSTAAPLDLTVAQITTMLSLGTAAFINVGTSANQIVRLNGSSQLPAVDGSLLTGLSTGVPTTRTVSAGTGLTGGGALSANITLSMTNTGVTAGTYGDTSGSVAISKLVIDAQGRISAVGKITGLSGSGGGGSPSCFPGSALVEMADGSIKRIDEVRIGEKVKGAEGELNAVIALERPLLATRLMFHLNREHWTSDEHPHMRPDKTFVSPNPNAIYAEWGQSHKVIVKNGQTEERVNVGLPEGLVTQMRVGQRLLKASGPVELQSLEIGNCTDWPPETQLFNLVLDGSGTYRVDSYIVTGWPNHERWDYETWTPK